MHHLPPAFSSPITHQLPGPAFAPYLSAAGLDACKASRCVVYVRVAEYTHHLCNLEGWLRLL